MFEKVIKMKKLRTWCYIMSPSSYEISCDICDGTNIAWSEYEGKIWCYNCQKDTPGTGGIFDGPIPIELCQALGMSFDRRNLKTGKIEKMIIKGDKIEWD